MAAQVGIVNIPSSAGTGAAKTYLQLLAAANQRVKILGYGFYLDNTTSTTAPAQLRILRQTTAGTTSAGTIVACEKDAAPTFTTTATINASAEPTAGDVLKTTAIPSYNGMYEYLAPFGQEDLIQGAGRLGFELNVPVGTNVRGYVKFEE